MGEYEPEDSRNVTQKPGHVPGEPPRTGPREDQAREKARRDSEDENREPRRSSAQPQQQQPFSRVQQGEMLRQTQQRGVQLHNLKLNPAKPAARPEDSSEDDLSQRGYGGAGEARERVIESDRAE